MAYSDEAEKSALPDKAKHKWFYYSVVYGVDKEHDTPYMTRMAILRLRLHIFHRGDADPDCHDHPWGFWTFPLVSYVEEVLDKETGRTNLRIVPSWRWSYRPATHAHRVLYSRYLRDGSSCYGHLVSERHLVLPENRHHRLGGAALSHVGFLEEAQRPALLAILERLHLQRREACCV